MKLVFTLFDAKTETHNPFGLFKTVSEAKRALVISLRGAPDIPPAQFPDDFTLCSCGTFDDTTAENPYKSESMTLHGSASSIIQEFMSAEKKDA